MGVDLYLMSIYKKNSHRYKPKYNEWMAKRDAFQKAGNQAEADKAEKRTLKYLDKMNEQGYFRDSYSPSNLLWLFELSWWNDVADDLIDGKGKMSPSKARYFLEMLKDREPIFKLNLKKVESMEGETKKETGKLFRDKYKYLRNLLHEAIDRKEPIECSL